MPYDKWLNIALFLVILFIGLIFGLIIEKIPFLVVDPKINVVLLSNMISVIVLAIAVPYFITNRIDKHKTKKQLVISELERFCASLDNIESQVTKYTSLSDNDEKQIALQKKIFFLFKKIRADWNSLKKNPLFAIVLITPLKNKIDTNLDDYWRYATGIEGVGAKPPVKGFEWKQTELSSKAQRNIRELMLLINET